MVSVLDLIIAQAHTVLFIDCKVMYTKRFFVFMSLIYKFTLTHKVMESYK